MKHRDKIIEYFRQQQAGTVVCANELYRKKNFKMSEAAFFKALERLAKENILTRVAKGMYMLAAEVPAADEGQNASEGTKTSSADELAAAAEHICQNEEVLNYFFGENNDSGMYIGSRLYFKYGISNVLAEDIWLYSNLIEKETKNIGNIHVKRVGIQLNYENTKVIEALEILQNYHKIENLNKMRFARFARQFAGSYNDEAAVYVLRHMKYKKSTIAFMKKILDMYKTEHSLQQFLSCASRYKVPPVQRVAR